MLKQQFCSFSRIHVLGSYIYENKMNTLLIYNFKQFYSFDQTSINVDCVKTVMIHKLKHILSIRIENKISIFMVPYISLSV